jgi:hypothetical protein
MWRHAREENTIAEELMEDGAGHSEEVGQINRGDLGVIDSTGDSLWVTDEGDIVGDARASASGEINGECNTSSDNDDEWVARRKVQALIDQSVNRDFIRGKARDALVEKGTFCELSPTMDLP